MMNSYFEQSGFYGGHGQTGAEQAYRFPLGLGVNPYGPPSGGVTRQVDSYDQSSAAAAAASAASSSCKLYEQQYKLDCSKADQNGYSSTGIVKSDNNSAISSWAAAAAAAAAVAQQDRGNSGHAVGHNNVNSNRGGVVVGGGGYPGAVSNVSGGGPEAAVAVSAVTPRSAGPNSVGPNNNPWSPCSLNATTAVAPVPQHGGVVSQHTQHSQHQHNAQQHHNTANQHAISQQQSPQSQSSAHTFYPWMAIAGKSVTRSFPSTTNIQWRQQKKKIEKKRQRIQNRKLWVWGCIETEFMFHFFSVMIDNGNKVCRITILLRK